MAVTADVLEAPKRTRSVIVPLSEFLAGRAQEIFDEVRDSGTKIVIDENDNAVCMLMAPQEYIRMSDREDNIKLRAVAEDRLKHLDMSKLIPAEDVYRELGITQEDIDGWEDVELE